MAFRIDKYATRIAVEKYALPVDLHIPIAARSEAAISRHIGRITKIIASGNPNNALLIELHNVPLVNTKLPIWNLTQASVLHDLKQLWVHVDYSGYRRAYINAFPDLDVSGLVLDHVLNRRVARLKGFHYLRIVAIPRAANSSSGGLNEKWAVEYHSTPHMIEFNRLNPAQIQYADLADIVKMLGMKTGNSLQDPVNEAQALLKEQ